ncbi:hypothetical protein BST61_g7556 [Cercospora zeina]
MLTKYLLAVTLVDNFRRFPVLPTIGRWVAPLVSGMQERQQRYTRELVEKRLRGEAKRKDFMTNVVSKVLTGEVSQEELTAHCSTLVIAGGETVASFFAASTYYLCANKHCLPRLQKEIRSRFSSLAEIDAVSAGQLKYLQAVIQEGLRIFPPGSQGFPRLSPGVEIEGKWIPKGTEIYTSAWAVTHDAANFHHANSFLPERWRLTSSDDLGLRANSSALMEINLLLATITNQIPRHLAQPIIDANLLVSDPSHVGLAIYYSATATQLGSVEAYGRDSNDGF